MAKPSLNAAFSSFRAKMPQTGHDLSRKFKFTAAPNQLLPVWQHRCNPREKFSIKLSAACQCQPIMRPCDLTVDQKVDFFFVPEQLIFTGFGNVLYETKDYITSGVNFDPEGKNPQQFPLCNFPAILTSLNSAANKSGYYFQDAFGSYYLSTGYFDSEAKGTFRLLMHLGYNPFEIFRGIQERKSQYGNYAPAVYPDFLAAYQAIYADFYRNDDREQRRLLSYQLDYLMSASIFNADRSLFYLRYAQRPKDYFTSLRVSPIMSTLNVRSNAEDFDDSEYSKMNVYSKINNYLSVQTVRVGDSHDDYDSSEPYSDKVITQVIDKDNIGQNVTTASLRSLFAVERLMRITGRAKKSYDSQVLAHIGVKVPRDVKHEVTHIGTFYGSFDVNKVMATANTAFDSSNPESTNLGELAGNGVGKIAGGKIYFDAPCHGVIMGIYSAVPRFSYPLGTMIDKETMVTERLDLWTPEFDRLGDQPMFAYEYHTGDGDGSITEIPNAMPLGWQRRYEQFKRKYDVHSLAFAQPFAYMLDDDFEYTGRVVNTWSPWVLGRYPFRHFFVSRDGENNIIDATPRGSDFLGSPCDLNDIFVQQYQTELIDTTYNNPWLEFQTDPFMVAMTVNVKMVSRMSVTGEPSLVGMGV